MPTKCRDGLSPSTNGTTKAAAGTGHQARDWVRRGTSRGSRRLSGGSASSWIQGDLEGRRRRCLAAGWVQLLAPGRAHRRRRQAQGAHKEEAEGFLPSCQPAGEGLCITAASGQEKRRLLAGPGARKWGGGCDSLPQDNPERVLCCEAD